ncbi:hypothetical protein P3L10_013785 [Capsicum annuum]
MILATTKEAEELKKTKTLDQQEQICELSHAIDVLSLAFIELYDSMVDKRDPEGEEEARKAYKAACEEDSDHTKERNVQHLLIGFTKCSKNLKRKSMIMMLRLVIVGGYWTARYIAAVGIAKNGIASDVHGSSNMHQPEDDLVLSPEVS